MKHIIYNRKMIGMRIQQRRISLGLTQREMSHKIEKSHKYYSDIECGKCGMSLETLITISSKLQLSLDYVIYGKNSCTDITYHNDDIYQIICMLDIFSEHTRKHAISILQFLLHLPENDMRN